MNKNIFENAYFGKAYKTRDGRKARFVINMGGNYGHPYRLVIEGSDHFFNYDRYGRMANAERDSDIVSEWQEEINEEELDKLAIEERADKYVGRLASSFLGFPDILEGGKNGYIVGAAEQKQIDIDKACKWLKESIGGELDLFRDEQDYLEWEKYFIKAMEEQI